MPDETAPADRPRELTVIVTETDGAGGASGVLVAGTGEIIYGDSATSAVALVQELTNRHGRREALDTRYPQGWEVSLHWSKSLPDWVLTAIRRYYHPQEVSRGQDPA